MVFAPRRPHGLHFSDGPEQRFQLRPVPGFVEPATTKSAAQSSLIMFLGTLFSRVLGLVRSPILLGAVVGGITSSVGNAFDIANTIPNFLYMIVVGGLVNAVLIPAIVRATKASDDHGAAFINKLLTMAIVFLGAITLILTIAAPLVVKLFAATLSEEWYRLTVAFAYWCLPQIFFYGMYTVLGQVLNARENFGPYMWAPALNNLVAVAGLLVILALFGPGDPNATAADWLGTRVALLGGFSTLGIVMQAVILIWPMARLGIRFRPDFQWRHVGLGMAGKASWWVLLSMITGMIPTIVLTNAAAGATDRASSMGIPLEQVAGNYVYSTANMIYTIPTSLIVVSVATAMFTRLATHAADENLAMMRRDFSKTIRIVSTLMALCSVLLIALAIPVSRVIAMSAKPQEIVTLSRVLIAMCLGLVAIGAVNVLDRAYYAFEDMRSVFWLNLPFQTAGLIGFAISGMLPPRITVVGIGLVMSLTNFGAAIVLSFALRRKMGHIDGKHIARTLLKLAVISAITLAIGEILMVGIRHVVVLQASIGYSILAIIVMTLVLSGVYFGLMKLARMEELSALVGPAHAILRKIGVK
jgi:putative peptidoglycan lipid II flippase